VYNNKGLRPRLYATATTWLKSAKLALRVTIRDGEKTLGVALQLDWFGNSIGLRRRNANTRRRVDGRDGQA
jgi:hypothetical protein